MRVRVCMRDGVRVINIHSDDDQVSEIRNKLTCLEEVITNLNTNFAYKFNRINFVEIH